MGQGVRAAGKSPGPARPPVEERGGGRVAEGDDARRSVREGRRRTTARQELQRSAAFRRVSPAPGRLDEDAFEAELARDADAALAMLADATRATDPALRELARRLAGRVVVRLATPGRTRGRGVGRLRRAAWEPGADVDLDASLDALVVGGRATALDELTATRWSRPPTAVALVVDRSGSMGGARLASAALAAAALSFRAPADWSVVAFADDALVLKAQDEHRSVDAVVDDILSLRGHGTTDVALALRTARAQLARSTSTRRLVLLLSDGRATTGADATAEARRVGADLLVLAPADDADDAVRLATAAGGRWALLHGPSSVPVALAALLG